MFSSASRSRRRLKIARVTARLNRRIGGLDSDDDASSAGTSDTPRTAVSMITADPGQASQGCVHYRRRCKIRAPCCGVVYPCRLCHDEEMNDPLKVQAGDMDAFENLHKLERRKIASIICVECDVEQPVSESCVKCLVPFAAYYCAVCKFWDDDLSKKIFHCEDCGICRVGGRENYFHCKVCDACYPLCHEGKHRCLAAAMKDVCCVCHESMFDSTKSVVVLVHCGHTIHAHCLTQYRKTRTEASYRCPLCGVPDYDVSAYEQAVSEAEWETLEVVEAPDDNDGVPATVEPQAPEAGG